jgi:sec-independent protein translocase protein TatC
MATKLKPIGHEERLSLVEHLDELRTRIIICVAAFAVAFGLCLWQDDLLLDTINRPLTQTAFSSCDTTKDPFEQANCWQQAMRRVNRDLSALAGEAGRQAAEEPRLEALAARLGRSADLARLATPRASPKRPVTLGVGEPFTATVRVAAYGALLISLPLLLYQAYAFLLPAFSPRERQVALPLMVMVPFLFIAGVVFAYFLVLPAAVNFLQNFNDDNYDILIQARDYYKFATMLMGVMGLLFQLPIGIIAVTRMGIVSTQQLRANRRYAILIIAVVAMLLPGADPVTMLSMMAPLLVLYEVSILLASLLDRRAERARVRAEADETDEAEGADEADEVAAGDPDDDER